MTIATCTHGMPSPASCITCMEDGPVMAPRPDATQLLRADRWITARYDGICARRSHNIEAGDRIGYVSDVGWCCRECAA